MDLIFDNRGALKHSFLFTRVSLSFRVTAVSPPRAGRIKWQITGTWPVVPKLYHELHPREGSIDGRPICERVCCLMVMTADWANFGLAPGAKCPNAFLRARFGPGLDPRGKEAH